MVDRDGFTVQQSSTRGLLRSTANLTHGALLRYRGGMTRLIPVVLLLLSFASASDIDTLRVLFIGNSHTYVNDLPGMFTQLSLSDDRVAITDLSAPGGYALMEHVLLQETLDKIARGGWDFVALQEQSQIPTIPFWRDSGMYPASRTLDSLICAQGSAPAFYMTWGWKNGGVMTYSGHSSPEFRDYFHMQDSSTAAYWRICRELDTRMSPVGSAWAIARRRDSLVDLWQPDECHATVMGTYLAACTFFAALWEADPRGLHWWSNLDSIDAAFCQQVAWDAVNGIAEPPGQVPALARPPATIVRSGAQLRLRSLEPGAGIEVCDATGRLVRRARSEFVETSNMSPGTYFCLVRSVNRTRTVRITVLP